jgi:hypothetical protein
MVEAALATGLFLEIVHQAFSCWYYRFSAFFEPDTLLHVLANNTGKI